MASVSDVTVPETKPATEFYFGRYIQKVSPRARHGLAQTQIGAALLRWADEGGRGCVASEWEHHIAPPGEPMNVFVPDAVFDVLSLDNTIAESAEKRRVFLACGTAVFVVADPRRRTLAVYDRDGSRELAEAKTFTHAALPGFELFVAEIFREPKHR